MRILMCWKFLFIGLIFGILSAASSSWAADNPGDSEITAAIRERLSADWGVKSEMNVETKGGIVKLRGVVESILAKERAVEIARSTKGVRAVVDIILLDVVNREGEDIQKDVISALKRYLAVGNQDIDVKVLDGVVTLSGTVDSFTKRYLAWRAAKGVKDVIWVENNIYAEHKERSDDEIKADIEGQFRDSVVINPELIKVQVSAGNVELTGSVGSASEKLRVNARSRAILGVKSVDDNGVVVNAIQGDMRRAGYDVAQSEEAIKNTVRDALLYDPRVNPAQINIEVKIPTAAVDVPRTADVTLTGTVSSLAVKMAAEEDARNTVGVSLVSNQLIAPERRVEDDSELMNSVEKALREDPDLGSFSLRISISDGNIRLSGTVGSNSDKQRAEDIVSSVKGVVSIKNDLKAE
jgi:osmotically-inducible protein OsmY